MYACDPTWNDPSGSEQPKSGKENEAYLLLGADTLNANGLHFDLEHYSKTNQYFCGISFPNVPPLLVEEAYEFERIGGFTMEETERWWE